MKLKVQKRIAADVLGCSPKKVYLDPSRAEDIKEAITKKDIRGLIKDGAIVRQKPQEQSRSRARKIHIQKHKGKRKGPGSRKGGEYSIVTRKERWMSRIRAQRNFLSELREGKKIKDDLYHDLYRKSKGGFFRSKRHIRIYLEERGLI